MQSRALPETKACIRQLQRSDLADISQLSRDAGWNQTTEDWTRLLEFASGCWGIEQDERIVATTTLVCYGIRLAWVGMVLTDPGYRGRGFARRLVAHSLMDAQERGVETVKLDATDAGRRLYEGLDFQPEQTVQRWVKQGGAAEVRETEAGLPIPLAADAFACGYDRASLLARLRRTGGSYIHGDNLLLWRSGLLNAYLGPFVAQDRGTGEELVRAALNENPECGWFWDLLPGNADALTLARLLGFVPCRSLTRMGIGTALHDKRESIYAMAGFELG